MRLVVFLETLESLSIPQLITPRRELVTCVEWVNAMSPNIVSVNYNDDYLRRNRGCNDTCQPKNG